MSSLAQGGARFVGLVFLAAAATKAWAPCEFAATLLQAAPGVPQLPVFEFVVATEVSAGAALLMWPESRRTIDAAFCLLAGLTLFLLIGIARWGAAFRCHCFAGILESSPLVSVARNLLLALLLVPSRLPWSGLRETRVPPGSPRYRA